MPFLQIYCPSPTIDLHSVCQAGCGHWHLGVDLACSCGSNHRNTDLNLFITWKVTVLRVEEARRHVTACSKILEAVCEVVEADSVSLGSWHSHVHQRRVLSPCPVLVFPRIEEKGVSSHMHRISNR